MVLICPGCDRRSASQRETCIYCGADLPDAVVESAEAQNLPADLDQLVRRAMMLGSTAQLESALRAHQDAAPEPSPSLAAPAPEPEPESEPISRSERLKEMHQACVDALAADAAEDEVALAGTISHLQSLLTSLGPVAPPMVEALPPKEVEPVILLPKVRRPYALVMEGPGDVELHEAIASALEIDKVTARMLALARQPRVVMRGEDKTRLEAMARGVRDHLNLAATVIDADSLRAMGPAHLLVGFTDGPTIHPIADWSNEFNCDGVVGELMVEAPALIVPGEIVINNYREAKQGGRLKHLREGRKHAVSEKRLAVVDVHIPGRIVRILERHSSLVDAPGATESFRQSLKSLINNWMEQGIRTLESRTCAAAVEAGMGGGAEQSALQDTGWATWEEHSRSSRALFIDE